MNPLRILHVVQNLNYGGMERVLADLIQGLDRDRFDLHVLTLQYRGRFSAGLERFATLHQAPPLPRFTMVFPGRLASVLAAVAPHIVHTHSGVWYKGALAARAAGVPRLMHTEHGRKSPDPWTDRIVDRLASRRTDVVVAGVCPGRQLPDCSSPVEACLSGGRWCIREGHRLRHSERSSL
jgi:hypothetical protein